MSFGAFLIFLHVTGALLLGFMVGLEWVMLINLRKAKSQQQAVTWTSLMKIIARLSPFTWLLILITGFYMMAKTWGMAGWLLTSIAGWLILFISGAILTAKKFNRILKEIGEDESFSETTRKLLNSNNLLVSLQLRTALTLGIVFLMTIKPETVISMISLAIFIIAGLIPVGRKKKITPAGN